MGISFTSRSNLKVDGVYVSLESIQELAASEKVSYFSNHFFFTTLRRLKFFCQSGVWINNFKIKSIFVEYEKLENSYNPKFKNKGSSKKHIPLEKQSSLKERIVVIQNKLEAPIPGDFQWNLTLKISLPIVAVDHLATHILKKYITYSPQHEYCYYQLSDRFELFLHETLIFKASEILRVALGTLNDFSMSLYSQFECVHTLFFTGPIEEVEFSLLLQEIGLRKLPQIFLRKYAPAYEHHVDHKAVKVARVVLRSLIFACAHYKSEFGLYGFINRLNTSLILGSLQESHHLIALTILTHAYINMAQVAYYQRCR